MVVVYAYICFYANGCDKKMITEYLPLLFFYESVWLILWSYDPYPKWICLICRKYCNHDIFNT